MQSFLLQLLGFTTLAVHAISPAVNISAPTGYWYEKIKHNGVAPGRSSSWVVFRNVKDYGAKGDGVTDDAAAIQRAITTGDSSGTRDSGRLGSTGQPAVVYFPPGTYVVGTNIKNYIGTVLMGDPTERPSIKASASFRGNTLISGVDPRYSGLVAFYHEIKNLIFDSTALSATTRITLLDWPVSQGSQLSNCVFNMPIGAASHTGIVASGMNSPLLINDLQFIGGGIGYTGSSTQYHFKNVYFKNITTGLKMAGIVQITGQGLRFDGVTTGVDMTGNTIGMFNLIDSTATNTQAVVSADAAQTSAQGSLLLENVIVDSTVQATVKAGGRALLTGSVEPGKAWVRGSIYSAGSATAPKKSTGEAIVTSRPPILVNGTGFYHTVVPPTYAEYDVSQIVNIRDVAGRPVAGDGVTDDTANLQAILNDTASKGQVAYFPHGIYLLTDTLFIPPGSRLFGESYTELSGTGSKFKDVKNPKPIIKVGNPGDVGVAQFTDFIFTVADVLPGAIMVEVNMAGEKPGDVSAFHCHFRIGGGRGTKTSSCKDMQTCNAVHIAAHFTASSSVYWENSWAWSADHDLDGGGFGSYPTPAGGFLIESQGGTWMLGLGVEHFVLYQVTLNKAKNVFIGLQEGEAAYYQGTGNNLPAPAPWKESLLPTDPDFSWCAANGVMCQMSIYQRVIGSSNVNLYSSGFWNFVAGPSRTMCSTDCQDNAVMYEDNSKLYSFGVSTINNKNMVLEPTSGSGTSKYAVVVARATNNAGVKDIFQTAVMAAYIRQSA